MVKIISNEEYAKLIGDVDYWKDIALKEADSLNFYENLCKENTLHAIYVLKTVNQKGRIKK